jgi:hypothetical protein
MAWCTYDQTRCQNLFTRYPQPHTAADPLPVFLNHRHPRSWHCNRADGLQAYCC